jgi:hypothetical protein
MAWVTRGVFVCPWGLIMTFMLVNIDCWTVWVEAILYHEGTTNGRVDGLQHGRPME